MKRGREDRRRLARRPGRSEGVAVLAEFPGPGPLVEAARLLRGRGYELLDARTPHPVEELEDVLGLPRTRLPRVALASGVVGGVLAYGIQWWTSLDGPPNVGGRPVHAAPAFIPITFETVILFASVALVVAFLWRVGLPRLWQPFFEVEGFERASLDRYWLVVDGRDARFDPRDTMRALADLRPGAPSRVILVDDEGGILREVRPAEQGP